MTDCIFPNRLDRLEMLCELSSPVTEATNSGLKLLLELVVKCSSLEVLGCYLSTNKYEVCGPLSCCCPLGTTWVC